MISRLFPHLHWLILVLMVAVIPLTRSPQFLYVFEGVKFFWFFLLTSLLLLSLSLQPTESRFTLPKGFIGFTLILVLACGLSQDRWVSILGNYGYFTDSLLVWALGLVIFSSARLLPQKHRDLVLVALVGTALVISLWGLYEYWQVSDFLQNPFARIGSTLGQPNRLAAFLLPLIPISFWLLIRPGLSLRWRFLVLVTFFLVGLVFLLTFSRTATITLMLFLIGVAGVGLRHHALKQNWKRLTKRVQSAKLFWGMALGGLGLLGIIVGPLVWQRFASIRLFPPTFKESGYLRFLELTTTTQIWLKAPFSRKLIGYGPNTTVYLYPRFQSPTLNQSSEWWRRTVKSRNQYLNTLNEMGIIGLVSFLGLFFTPVKVLFDRQEQRQNRFLAASLVLIGLQGFFYYIPLTVWVVFFIFQGWLHPIPLKKAGFSRRLVPTAIAFMVATAGIVFSLRFASAEALAVTDDIDKLKKATQTYPFEGTYAQRLSRKYRLQGEAFAREQKLPETRMSFRLALDQSQAALSRHPLDLTLMQTHQWNYYKMGVLLDKTYHQQSLSLAKTITQLAPSDPRSWDRLGLVYLDMGELDQAQTQFQTCLLLKPDYVGGLLHLGETFKQQGREELALPLYEQAAALSNSQIAQEELEKAKNDPDFSQK